MRKSINKDGVSISCWRLKILFWDIASKLFKHSLSNLKKCYCLFINSCGMPAFNPFTRLRTVALYFVICVSLVPLDYLQTGVVLLFILYCVLNLRDIEILNQGKASSCAASLSAA